MDFTTWSRANGILSLFSFCDICSVQYIKYPIVPRVHCCNKVVLKRPCCVCLMVFLIQVELQNITFLATRIGRSSTSLDSTWFWDNAVCAVAYKMTSTNMTGLFGRVGKFNVEHEMFSAYIKRMEMFFLQPTT